MEKSEFVCSCLICCWWEGDGSSGTTSTEPSVSMSAVSTSGRGRGRKRLCAARRKDAYIGKHKDERNHDLFDEKTNNALFKHYSRYQ